MAEHARNRILAVVKAILQTVDGTGSFTFNLTGNSQVRIGRVPKEQINTFPCVAIVDGPERYEDDPHPLYTRTLTILGEALLKVDSGDPQLQATRLLKDLEIALGANPTLEETPGNPATRIAVELRIVDALPMIDFPATPYVTLSFTLEVIYRTLRADPTVIR
jgi:hypothetical protein